jgi:Uma2 family endonuclease
VGLEHTAVKKSMSAAIGEPLMTAVAKKKLTPAEYLEIERAAPTKSEFCNGEMFAMAGASRNHTVIKDNVCAELRSRLKDRNCRPYSAELRVRVTKTGLYTYPDVVVACGEPKFEDQVMDTLLTPNIIIEVLSDSTEKYDRGVKFRQYQQLDSLTEYVLVSQDAVSIDRFVRQPDNTWILTTFTDLNAEFSLVSVPVCIPMAEIYRDVEFDEPRVGAE